MIFSSALNVLIYPLILGIIRNNGLIALSKYPIKYFELVFVLTNFEITILSGLVVGNRVTWGNQKKNWKTFFRAHKILITFTMILTLFFFFFYRKILISCMCLFLKLFFAFLIIVSCHFYIQKKIYKKYFHKISLYV